MDTIDKIALTNIIIMLWCMALTYFPSEKVKFYSSLSFVASVAITALYITYKILYGVWK